MEERSVAISFAIRHCPLFLASYTHSSTPSATKLLLCVLFGSVLVIFSNSFHSRKSENRFSLRFFLSSFSFFVVGGWMTRTKRPTALFRDEPPKSQKPKAQKPKSGFAFCGRRLLLRRRMPEAAAASREWRVFVVASLLLCGCTTSSVQYRTPGTVQCCTVFLIRRTVLLYSILYCCCVCTGVPQVPGVRLSHTNIKDATTRTATQ